MIFPVAMNAQDFKSIIKSIETGNIENIEGQLDEVVDYCFNDEQDLLEKPEFIAALRTAIDKINPSSSELVHVADSKGADSKYAVAKLKSSGGDSYRMFVYVEEDKIVEIRFNQE